MRGPLNLLLVGLPVAVASQLLDGPGALTLGAAALSLVPLAAWIAKATEQLASRVARPWADS